MWLCRGRGEMTKEHVLFSHFLCEKWGLWMCVSPSAYIRVDTVCPSASAGEDRISERLQLLSSVPNGSQPMTVNATSDAAVAGGWLVRPQTTS